MRKESFIILVVACMSALCIHAQVGDPRRDVAIGVSAGVSLNTVSFHPSVAQTMKASPYYGIAIRYNCEKYFASLCGLQAEVNYCNLGWQEDFSESAHPDYHYMRDMHYISVPLMARMGWGKESGGLMGFILAGPQFGFFLDESEDICAELANINPNMPMARRAQYGKAAEKKFDYGITAGAGVELNTRRAGHFVIEARYYLGLSDIYNNGKADYFGRSANNTITASFSYYFDVLRTKKK